MYLKNYVEDRILWNNLSVKNKLISIDHKEIRHRIPIKAKKLNLQTSHFNYKLINRF